MKKIWATMAIVVLSGAPSLAEPNAIAGNVIEGYILPGYTQLVEAATAEVDAVEMLCGAPSADTLGAARQGFDDLALAWSQIEPVRFGPVTRNNRLERILFWPDRRSIGLKQVQAVIASKDESATSVETLRQKSVALQGLTALEFLLFGTGSETLAQAESEHRCSFARAVAGAIAQTATDILLDWRAPDGIADALRNPGPERPDYRTDDEVAQEMIGIIAHGVELIRDTRIKPFVGETAENARPKRALYWRSDNALSSIAANMAGLKQMFTVSMIEAELPPAARSGDQLIFEMDNFLRTARALDMPLADAVRDPEMRSKLDYLVILTGSIQKITFEQIAVELGLIVGFSSLDGD